MPQKPFFNPTMSSSTSSKPVAEQVLEEKTEKEKMYANMFRITEGKAPLKEKQTEKFTDSAYYSSWEYFAQNARNPNFRPGNNQ